MNLAPNEITIGPLHLRVGLEWFFENFASAIAMTDEEAPALLNSTSEEVARFREQFAVLAPIEVLPEVVERLSLLLGIYGAIANIAPDGPSRFVYLAFREARQPFYGGHTLMEYLLNFKSLDRWYSVRAHLRSLEAGFIG